MTWHHLLDAFVLDKRAENRMSERSDASELVMSEPVRAALASGGPMEVAA